MDELRELATQGAADMGVRSRSMERRTSSNAHPAHRHELRVRIASLRKQRLALSLTSAGLLAASFVVGYTAYHFHSIVSESQARLAEDRVAFESRLRETEAELLSTREALAAAQASVGMLVEQRIPGLRPLQPNQVVAIGESSVRDIAFTTLRGSEKNGLEYKAVIENDSTVPVSPAVRVLLFDRVGVELGRSQIGLEPDGKKTTLRPGEIRSYFAVVKLDPGREPAYFRLDPTPD